MRNFGIHGGRRGALVAAMLGLACAPVASHAQVLFSDNFNTNTLSRYDVFSFDQAVSTTAVVNGVGTNDVQIKPAFNYGGYTYRHIADNEIDTIYSTIPVAPRTTDGTTLGLYLDVNNTGGTTAASGGQAVINLLPKMAEFAGGQLPSGNYKLTVDVWMNYNGPALGGGGSTEWMIAGVNQRPASGLDGLSGLVFADPAVQQRGQTIAIDGERGNSLDYRIYHANSRLGTLDPSTGYVAPLGGQYSAADARNQFYQDIFTYPAFETRGAIGKHWVTLQAESIDGTVFFSLDAHLGGGMQLIAARTDYSSTSGNVALGYGDLNGGRAALENSGPVTDTDANFVVYDNLVVEQLAATPAKPTWTAGSGAWLTGGNWANGTPNSASSYAVFGAGAAGATVTVGSPVTVREITLDNTGMTIGGAGPLVMDSPGTTGGIMGTFNVRQGNHTVSAPVTVNKNLLFHVEQAASSLTFTQPLADNTFQITKSGDGTVNLRGGRNGGLIVLGGKVSLAPGSGTMVTNSLLVVGPIANQRGSIDLNNNKLVLDYTGAIASQNANIRGTIRGAFANGTWGGAGLTSSEAVADANKIKGVGYWEAATLLGLTGSDTATWFGQTVDATSLLIAVTYMGDLNFDNKVNGDDLAILDRSILFYGVATTTDPRGIPTGTAKWVDGDVNYDGALNAADYVIIDKSYGLLNGGLSPAFLAMREGQFGAEYVAALVASVPEPGAVGLLAGAALAGMRRRRR